jgi:hypothetical protein
MKPRVIHIIACVCLTLICSVQLSGDVMEWDSSFDDINIITHITTQNSVVSGSSTATLHTDGDAEITADNTATAQLSCASDTLVTEYKLEYDGDGTTETGGSTVDWTAYNSFLISASSVTHVTDDDYVDVTLHVRASNDSGNVANAGTYTAIQTLTAHWVGP